jgi:intracellular sulfur oxidation DsrE/DsrF family protein
MNAMLVTVLVCAVGVSAAGLSGAAETSQGPHRVVMHLNTGDEKVQRGALNNIRHLYQEVGREQLRVELVVHGAGLTLLTKRDSTLATELAQLKAAFGVEFTACSNTMKAMNLTTRDLVEQVDRTVPAMVRLMELQEQGWAYIKP